MNSQELQKKVLRQGYSGVRPDIMSLIPKNPKRVLDVGCGAGELGRTIKELSVDAIIVGLDNDAKLIQEATSVLDKVYRVDLNMSDPFELLGLEERFDVIVMADVLEHVINPQYVLGEARTYLAPQGCIITSLPNVRHYSTFVSLLFGGVWPERDRGIHDRTHLHFFTRKNMLTMFEKCQLTVKREKRNVRLIEHWSWTNIPGKLFDFWPFRGFLTFQYLHLLIDQEHWKN